MKTIRCAILKRIKPACVKGSCFVVFLVFFLNDRFGTVAEKALKVARLTERIVG